MCSGKCWDIIINNALGFSNSCRFQVRLAIVPRSTAVWTVVTDARSLSLSIHIMCAYRTCSIWALEGLPFHCSPHAANISNLLLSRDHFFHALLCSIYMLLDWIEGTQCVQQRERVTSLNMVNYVMMMMGRYDDIFVPFHILHFVRSFRCFFVFFYDYSVRPKWEFNVDQQQWP